MGRASKNLAECPEEFGGVRVTDLLESLRQWREALLEGDVMPWHPRIVSVE